MSENIELSSLYMFKPLLDCGLMLRYFLVNHRKHLTKHAIKQE